jgi:hypothetical protein
MSTSALFHLPMEQNGLFYYTINNFFYVEYIEQMRERGKIAVMFTIVYIFHQFDDIESHRSTFSSIENISKHFIEQFEDIPFNSMAFSPSEENNKHKNQIKANVESKIRDILQKVYKLLNAQQKRSVTI